MDRAAAYPIRKKTNYCGVRWICAPGRPDWEFIGKRSGNSDPRLPRVRRVSERMGRPFSSHRCCPQLSSRARGGLVEHTAQMMRIAREIAPLYPQLNADLLLAGILFHDCGNCGKTKCPKMVST